MHKIRVLSPHLHIWVFACYCGEEKAKWFTLKLLEIFVPQIHNYSLNSEWLSFTLDIVFYNGLCLLSYQCALPLYHLVGLWSWNFCLIELGWNLHMTRILWVRKETRRFATMPCYLKRTIMNFIEFLVLRFFFLNF